MGIHLEEPGYIALHSNQSKDWINALKDDVKNNNGNPPEIVVCLVQFKDKGYKEMKKYCVKSGIQCQYVVAKSLFGKNTMSVCSKILVQMAAKLGKTVWKVPRPMQVGEKTMIVGIDKYMKLIQKEKACLGFVASADSSF